MRTKFDIPLSYNPIQVEELMSVLHRYAASHHDEMISDFEKEIASITNANHVVALNSGTAGIHLGLKALGVGPGDIVIASTFTYVASINPILYLGAEPVFVDSSADDWNMDPRLLEQAVLRSIQSGKLPKVILVVHTYGMPAKMNEIIAIAERHGIAVLEDAAEALGSLYRGKPAGTIGHVGVLSFNNNKLITTYGGGAVLTNDSTMADKINLWASQSRDNLPYYEHQEVGYNYRISPLNAAAGLAQLGFIEEKIRHRREVMVAYQEYLGDRVKWQDEDRDCYTNRWLTTVLLPGTDAAHVQQALQAKKIEARPVWKPMHNQPVFSRFNASLQGTSEQLFYSGLCLPSGSGLEEQQIKFISGIILNALK